MSWKLLTLSVVDSGHFLTSASSPLAGSVAASDDMIDGTSPAATAAASSARRFMYAPSGVISDGFTPKSNFLNMTHLPGGRRTLTSVAFGGATWLEYPCNNNTQQRLPQTGAHFS